VLIQRTTNSRRSVLTLGWISTVGNYDYIFDWIFHENGTIGIDAGATGIEAVKGVKAKTMHDETAKDDTRYGTLIDHNIVGTDVGLAHFLMLILRPGIT
ncbi:copper amine oxidase, partial [Escherichia sp. TWPC-MK]